MPSEDTTLATGDSGIGTPPPARLDASPKTDGTGHRSRSAKAPFPPVLLSRRQAAAYLSISPRTLWSLTAAGKIRSVTIGTRMVRYTVADLDAFVASCRGGRR